MYQAIRHLSKNDKILKGIISRYPLTRTASTDDLLESLIKIIIDQQLSVASAQAIANRFFNQFPDPSPEKILDAGTEVLRESGLSRAKTTCIQDLCKKIIYKELNINGLSQKSDFEIKSELMQIRGIGEWTADVFLLFGLNRPDILPAGDLALRKAVMNNYKMKRMPDREEVKILAQKNGWSPYRSYASLSLWNSLKN
ncbi:MAG: hypothetical protein K9I71_04160 [Ignavibacteriales bacterium]|nr:hypothetical protein [Ignavibacteriales bacterium]MCF8315291.1 hypothetical protein [Ignavibacteriales bacterium]MCF8436817.1 hypothetical protein [Ignavibacteriales bacterium]